MKKITILSILLTIFLVFGFGCKGLTAEEKAAIRPVNIKYWTVFNDVNQLKAFAEEYKRERPYVTISVRKVREEEFENLFVNALADDVPPDIISVHTRDLQKYRKRLSSMPASVEVSDVFVKGKYAKETVVTPVVNSLPSTNAIKAHFVSAVYDDVVIGGKAYGLPLALDTMALYYNKDLLDQAGIPEPPTTWTDFLEAVKTTTRFNGAGDIVQSGVALGTGNNIDRAFDTLSLFMLQSGVKIMNGNTVNFAYGLKDDNPKHATLAALRFYTDFAQPTKEVYSWNEDMGNAFNSFVQGKSVFYFGFAYDYPRIKARAPQLNIEIVPVPQLNEQRPVNVANYWIESVVKKSKNKDEAWDFIRFMTTPEKIKQYTEATRRPTPLRSQIKEQEEDLVLAPFVSTVLQAESWYKGSDVKTAEKAFAGLIHKYLQPHSGTKTTEILKNIYAIQHAASIIRQTI